MAGRCSFRTSGLLGALTDLLWSIKTFSVLGRISRSWCRSDHPHVGNELVALCFGSSFESASHTDNFRTRWLQSCTRGQLAGPELSYLPDHETFWSGSCLQSLMHLMPNRCRTISLCALQTYMSEVWTGAVRRLYFWFFAIRPISDWRASISFVYLPRAVGSLPGTVAD